MFGFENAEVSKGNYKETINPGINLVKVVKIENGLSSKAQAPQLTITVEDAHGAELANSYSLNTVINPGKKMSGWDVTKNAILSMVAAALSLDEVSAKAKMPNAKSAEELAQKLSVLLTGKEFRLKVVGEEKISQKGKKYVASSFGNGVFCESKSVPEAESKLFFSPEKNIKKLDIEPATNSDIQSTFPSVAGDVNFG
jgi:hypothetical protein